MLKIQKPKTFGEFLKQTAINFLAIIFMIVIVKLFGIPIVNRAMVSAASNGNTEVVKQKLDYFFADVDGKNRGGETALIIASRLGYTDTVKLLLDYGATVSIRNDGNNSALVESITHHHFDITELLLDKGVKPEDANRGLSTLALQGPVTLKMWELAYHLKPVPIDTYQKLTDRLMRQGADVNDSVMHAVFSDNFAMLDILRSHGADLNQSDEYGECPMFKVNSPAMVDYLVQHEIDVNCQNNNGNIALFSAESAMSNPEILKKMLTHGANINNKLNDGTVPKVYNTRQREFLLERGADQQIIDDPGETLLHHAINKDECEKLINKGINIESTNKSGQTAIFTCNRLDTFQCLLNAGANPNAVDDIGNTPLHYANYDEAKLLLNAGANPLIKNKKGQTPLDAAQDKPGLPNPRLLEILKQAQSKQTK